MHNKLNLNLNLIFHFPQCRWSRFSKEQRPLRLWNLTPKMSSLVHHSAWNSCVGFPATWSRPLAVLSKCGFYRSCRSFAVCWMARESTSVDHGKRYASLSLLRSSDFYRSFCSGASLQRRPVLGNLSSSISSLTRYWCLRRLYILIFQLMQCMQPSKVLYLIFILWVSEWIARVGKS